MKLRLLPILISVVITSTVLFGGWFVYHSVAMENPLTETMERIDGVESVQMDIDGKAVTVELKLRSDASLRSIYETLLKEGESIIGKREVKLKVINDSTPSLEQIWSSALFDVAQAMENKQYADIPGILESVAKEQKDLKVAAEMDEKNVYIRLTKGSNSKFVILPRTPVKLGVWPNE